MTYADRIDMVTRTLDDYQSMAMRTAPQRPRLAAGALAHGLAELMSEAGEVAGLVKRQLYNNRKGPFAEHQFVDHMADELGDVLWSVAYLAHTCGVDLSDIASRNILKLDARKEQLSENRV